jgi:hypothetical protein
MMVAVAIISLIAAGMTELRKRRVREAEIQRALLDSLQPPGWWPAGWRQELNTSFTVEGHVTLGGKTIGAGTIWFILMPAGRAFAANISKGKYSMTRGRMPTGNYRIEVESLDGPKPQKAKGRGEMPMDQGRHGLNFAF